MPLSLSDNKLNKVLHYLSVKIEKINGGELQIHFLQKGLMKKWANIFGHPHTKVENHWFILYSRDQNFRKKRCLKNGFWGKYEFSGKI